jgi:hypothetical protein
MAKLTDDVEAELQRRMEVWDTVTQDAAERLGRILPMADSLWERVGGIESLLQNGLAPSVREAAIAAGEGEQSAQALQQLLGTLVKTVLESNSELAFAHEQSIQRVSQMTKSEMGVIHAAMQGAFASALSLQREIVSTTSVAYKKLSHQSSDKIGAFPTSGGRSCFSTRGSRGGKRLVFKCLLVIRDHQLTSTSPTAHVAARGYSTNVLFRVRYSQSPVSPGE